MHYVYVLQSLKDKSYYTGITDNVERRVVEHNSGSTRYSSSKRPYELVWFGGFRNKTKAIQFEQYLK